MSSGSGMYVGGSAIVVRVPVSDVEGDETMDDPTCVMILNILNHSLKYKEHSNPLPLKYEILLSIMKNASLNNNNNNYNH